MKKIILTILIIIVGAYFYYWQNVSSPLSQDGSTLPFMVASGEGVDIIAGNLYDFGLIKNKSIFKIYIWQTKNQANLQAGEYRLSSGMSVKEIADVFVNGQSLSKEREIKIIEGWTLNDIAEYLAKEGVADRDSFINAASQIPDNYKFLSATAAKDLEGYLFPDTYRIFNDASANDIVEKMLDNLESKLSAEMLAEIERQDKTVHDIITLASIIEKEVVTDNDQAVVSGILQKRILIGMPLEVDSSINYITGKSDPSATYQDLAIDSPYNTYKYYGLPPGPISSPGIASIKAAIYPVDTPYLFYLNRQDTGETLFSKNYEEHLRKKAKYLK